MYYNLFTKKVVLDSVDYFLISASISCYLTAATKNYLSEEEAVRRLKRDWIRKSKRKAQRRYKTYGFSKSQKELEKLKIERIAKVALQGLYFKNLYIRGGQNDYNKFHNITTPVIEYFSKKKNISIQKPKFNSKKKLKNIFKNIRGGQTEVRKKLLQLVLIHFIKKTNQITVFLLAALHSKRDNIICKFLYSYLLALLKMSFINVIIYYDIDSGKLGWICIASGGAFGIFAALLLSIHIPLTVFLSRNIYQQFTDYFKYRNFIQRAKELGIQNLEEFLEKKLNPMGLLPYSDAARLNLFNVNMNLLKQLISEGAEKEKIIPVIKKLNSISQKISITQLETLKQLTEKAIGESLPDMPGIPTIEPLIENPIMDKPNLGIRIRN